MAVYTSFPIYGNAPREGARRVPISMPFAAGLSQTVQLTFNLADSGVSQIEGIYIDNSQNAWWLYLTVQDSGQIISIPARCVYTGPIYTGGLSVAISALGQYQEAITINGALLNFRPQESVRRVNPLPYGAGTPYIAPSGNSGNFVPLPNSSWQQVLPPRHSRYGFYFSCINNNASVGTINLAWGDEAGNLDTANGFWRAQLSASGGAASYVERQTHPELPIMTTSLWAYATVASVNAQAIEYAAVY